MKTSLLSTVLVLAVVIIVAIIAFIRVKKVLVVVEKKIVNAVLLNINMINKIIKKKLL